MGRHATRRSRNARRRLEFDPSLGAAEVGAGIDTPAPSNDISDVAEARHEAAFLAGAGVDVVDAETGGATRQADGAVEGGALDAPVLDIDAPAATSDYWVGGAAGADQALSAQPVEDVAGPVAASARERVASRRRAKKTRRRPVLRIVLAVLGVLVVLALLGAATVWAFLGGLQKETRVVSSGIARALNQTVRPPGKPLNILVMGSDIRQYEIKAGVQHARADTIMLFHIDPATKKMWVLSFPRDMRVPIPGYGTDKINAADSFGGPPLLIETIKQLTGLQIDQYVEVNFEGFKQLVDAIGGVWVNVDTPIHDIKAANHDQSAMDIQPGYQKLDGKHALTFVRSRHFPTGDFMRIKHQQVFMDALLSQSVRFQNIFKLPQLIGVFRRNVRTSMSVPDMTNLAWDLKGIKKKDLQKAMVTGKDATILGIYYLLPDQAKLALLVERMQKEQPFEGPSTGPIPNKDITISVLNGTKIKGRGLSMFNRLKAIGFHATDVATAKQQNYVSTLIIYKPAHLGAAMQVQKGLGMGKLQAAIPGQFFTSNVLVITGKDYVPGAAGVTAQAGGAAVTAAPTSTGN